MAHEGGAVMEDGSVHFTYTLIVGEARRLSRLRCLRPNLMTVPSLIPDSQGKRREPMPTGFLTYVS